MSPYIPSEGYPMRYPVNVGERRMAIRVLTARGFSAREIAEMLGICTRTVVRHRRRP